LTLVCGIAARQHRLWQRDAAKSNLCFAGFKLLASVSHPGDADLTLLVDTGDNDAFLYPRYLPSRLDSLPADTRKTSASWSAQGAHGECQVLSVPRITARVEDFELSLAPILIGIEPFGAVDEADGAIGMRFFDQARQVTLDFHAMRLIMQD
jgi:hypothetical protein